MIGIFSMNNRYFLGVVNSILSILFLTSFLEVFTYSGFFIKHFSYIVGILLVLLALIFFLIFNKVYKTRFLRNISFWLAFLMMFLYILINILKKIIYFNYVFSYLHINPNLLLIPTILTAGILLLDDNRKRAWLFMYIIIIIALDQYIVTDFNAVKSSRPFFMLKNVNLGYDKKMEMAVGKVPYDFAMFIKDNTSPHSNILIPPQGFPWPKTGNVGYLRYFLYPRNLINGNEKDLNVNIKDIDYVLIDYGEESRLQYGFTNIWPKFNVNGEYIIYWDPLDGTVQKVDNGKYVYNPDNKMEEWGIIKIRK